MTMVILAVNKMPGIVKRCTRFEHGAQLKIHMMIRP